MKMAITLHAILHKEKGKKIMTKFKKTIALIAALCLLIGMLAACTSSDAESTDAVKTTAEPSAEPTSDAADKEITIALYRDGAIDTLDAATYNGPHVLYKMIYEGFVEDGGNGTILPQLATSWDISEDGKTYTFHLREGVKFSDGTDFNADAVIFNLNRWMNNDRHASLTCYKAESYEALDEYTVRIVFAESTYSILTELTYPRPNRFLAPSCVEDNGEVMGNFKWPVGTGQWMVEEYIPDEQVTLVPNPYYWGEKPALERIIFKVIPSGEARIMALESGEVDIIGGELLGKITSAGYSVLENDGVYELYAASEMCAHYMNFSQDNGLFQDVRVRQAVNYAIDNETLAATLLTGIGTAAKGLYNVETVPYVTEQNSPGYAYDLDLARSLIAEAGLQDSDGDGFLDKDGVNYELSLVITTEEFPEWSEVAQFIQSSLAQIGLKVNIRTVDTNAYNEIQMTTLDYDLIFQRTSSASWVPHNDMTIMFTQLSVAQGHARVWYDAQLVENIWSALRSQDEAERQKYYDLVFGQIQDEALLVPLYYPTVTFAVNPEIVSSFEIGTNNYAPVQWTTLTRK